MTPFQKIVKYLAIAFGAFLACNIIVGIVGVLALFTGSYDRDAVSEEWKTYEVSSPVEHLEIEIGAADFSVRRGKSFLVESNLKNLTVRERNGALTVEETKRFGKAYTDSALILWIPEDAELETICIKTGAGRLTADYLSGKTVKLELGAGEVKIDCLIATERIEINGGAGKITVSDGFLQNLDLDMGIGRLDLTAEFAGESDFDLGVGASHITVRGNRDDYRLEVEKGIGNVTVDGKAVSRLEEQGKGPHSLEIQGGVGAICLNFEKALANG